MAPSAPPFPDVLATVLTPARPAPAGTVQLDDRAAAAIADAVRAYQELSSRRFAREPVSSCGQPRADDATGRPTAARMPEAGVVWQGFELVAELGRGSYGRVFLARQGVLANRLVALKLSTDLFAETQTLAQLQHTNIVPIYSAHQAGPIQALCMPYLGSLTLQHVVDDLHGGATLPASGKVLVSTLNNRRNSTRQSEPAAPIRPSAPAVLPTLDWTADPLTANANAAEPAVYSDAVLKKLERLSYVDAVLWIGSRLAEGLVHAHERGVVHRDLKPANVLLTDEGEPMLLDFNLSDSLQLRGAAAARIGGTLPYMAPEHLEAFAGAPRAIDARCDVYALGVMLFELLTGKLPFAIPKVSPVALIALMVADRQVVPRLRGANPMVSPAAESIVRRCFAPDPADRYQSAAELLEDLTRHRADLPLRHAPEPSLRERASKFARRHRRLTVAALVAAVVALAVGLPAAGYAAREGRLHRAARAVRQDFLADRERAQQVLNRPDAERVDFATGTRAARAALERYGALDGADWAAAAVVRYLPDDERAQLGEDVEELLLLLARAAVIQAEDDAAVRLELLLAALDWNARAEAACGERPFSRAGWMQRAELARLLGDEALAEVSRRAVEETAPRTARDHFLLAREQMSGRRFREALPHLQTATELNPRHFWAWYLQGVCHYELRQDVEAAQCYRAGLAVWPESHLLHLGRALVYQRQGRHDKSEADFDEAIRLRPDLAESYVSRAILRGERGRSADAIADLDCALELDAGQTRAYFLRATERRKVGDTIGAARDEAEGMRQAPTNAVGWTTRGYARLASDPRAALADFEEALRLNPRYRDALQNKAHVLSEHLGRTQDALAVIDREVALYPDYTLARLGRAVLRARLGKTDAARADARICLEQDNDPATLYQVANVYALTSPRVEGDKARALDLLAAALRGGFGLDLVDDDPDFAPLRADPEFRRRVEAARTLQAPARGGEK